MYKESLCTRAASEDRLGARLGLTEFQFKFILTRTVSQALLLLLLLLLFIPRPVHPWCAAVHLITMSPEHVLCSIILSKQNSWRWINLQLLRVIFNLLCFFFSTSSSVGTRNLSGNRIYCDYFPMKCLHKFSNIFATRQLVCLVKTFVRSLPLLGQTHWSRNETHLLLGSAASAATPARLTSSHSSFGSIAKLRKL